jgi:choline dehydrogenase
MRNFIDSRPCPVFRQNATMSEISIITIDPLLGMTYQTLLPFSWGRVHLGAGGDASSTPVIESNFLDISFDLDVVREAGRLAVKALETAPLSEFVAIRVVPTVDQLPDNATDEQWDSYLLSGGGKSLSRTETFGHACS